MIAVFVSPDKANRIIETRCTKGKFWTLEKTLFIGIDNTTGDAWVENFTDKAALFNWLKGEFEVGD